MAYEKVNWSDTTPINVNNLNNMDVGIQALDVFINNVLPSTLNSIVETGTNEDGTWIKFACGIMICTKIITTTVTCNKQWGSVYESEQIDLGKMAQPFKNIPTILTGNIGRTGILEGFQQTTNEHFGYTWLMRPVIDTHEAEYKLHILAIGEYDQTQTEGE